jgi:hypothetical protein
MEICATSMPYELILFSDNGLKVDLINRLEAEGVEVRRPTFMAGMPLRLSFQMKMKTAFQTAINWWKEHKDSSSMSLTLRNTNGLAIEVNNSNIVEAQKMVDGMRD